MKRVVAVLLVAIGYVTLAKAPVAHAEVSAWCVQHLAERPGTTPGEDRRFHLARGEFSPCTESDSGFVSDRGGSSDHRREREGSFCDGRWWC